MLIKWVTKSDIRTNYWVRNLTSEIEQWNYRGDRKA